MMRGPFIASAGVHLAVVAALFMLHGPAPLVVPGPEVVQVSLVSPDFTQAPTPPTPPKIQPPRKAPTIAPESGEGVKLTPPKPPKTPKSEPPPEPAPEPEVAPALPWARVGPAGLSGQVQVDAKDFEFTYYLMLVRNRVAQNWAPPAGIGAGAGIQAVAFFQIARDGSVHDLKLESGSGLEYFDRSVLRAVALSDPLPPLPLGFTGATLGVHFGFSWGGS
ncbi:MAG: TonB C-terminal domain-containing protein [Candidatus Eiseniibacteriota bacterium]